MSGTIPKAGTLIASDPSFGIARDYELIGGWAAVADEATIGAIASGRLVANGTWRASIATGITYLYTSSTPSGGFANGTWVVVGSTSSSSWAAAQLVATTNLTLSGEQTIDGVLTSGSRVLVTGQTTQSQNGIYVTAAGAWSRDTDANLSAEFTAGKTIAVTAGSVNAGTIWVYNGASSPTIGTTAITFAENSAGGSTFNAASPPPIGNVTPNTIDGSSFTSHNATGYWFATGVSQFFAAKLANFSSDADVDWTSATTSYNKQLIWCGGAGTLSVTRKLILPPGGPWLVYNGKTQPVAVTPVGGGTAVTVQPGSGAVVWSPDGTNFTSGFNPHGPGPIGDVTPSTLAATQLTNTTGTTIATSSDGNNPFRESMATTVAITSDSATTLFTLASSIASGKTVTITCEIHITKDSSTDFGIWRRTIIVRNQSGTLLTPSGGTSDSDISPTGNLATGLSTATSVIDVTVNPPAIKVTRPAGIACHARVAVCDVAQTD